MIALSDSTYYKRKDFGRDVFLNIMEISTKKLYEAFKIDSFFKL